MSKKPVVLAIADGWGVAPASGGNAITESSTPNFDKYLRHYPAINLYASGNEVGLLFGEMGNSEVGHLNIGAGRVYYQTCPRINKEISEGDFFNNEAFVRSIEQVKNNNSNLHLIGLVSNGNVHSSNDHLYALLDLCKQNDLSDNVMLHVILDGRDCTYNSGREFVSELQAKMKELKVGKIASISGRYFALDRDNRWDRIEKAYRAMAEGVSEQTYDNPITAIDESYGREVYDEQFVPVAITENNIPVATFKEGDAAIFYNFRPDRARQLTKAFVLPGFKEFERTYFKSFVFATLTEYEKQLPVLVAYMPVVVHNSLAEVISKAGLKQLHTAETEKYAHVTFFLNGTVEEPFVGEDRKLIPSPHVSTYDQQPEMSAVEVGKEVNKALDSEQYDFIVVNFANPDMVGHTGNLDATTIACETVDKQLGKIVDNVLAHDGIILLTSDHGNSEQMINLQTGDRNKEHTTNPVPLIMIGKEYMGQAGTSGDPPEGDLSLLPPVGILADIAPTILKLLGLEQPEEMTGQPLI